MNANLNIVVSVYNEEAVLPSFYNSITSVLEVMSVNYRIIFVNDGSTDRSELILRSFALNDPNVLLVNFSRNFGHEYAMMSGLDHSDAEAVICMDADLQHPPELIPEIWEAYRDGADIVTMIRSSREDSGFLKGICSRLFYKFINRISDLKIDPNASDFFLISKRVCTIVKNDYRERTRFLRGFIQMVGFQKVSIQYIAPKRLAGQSKYGMIDLIRFSFSAIASLSKAPLRVGIYLGLFNAAISLGIGIYSLVMYFLDKPYSGYTTIILFLTLMFSMLFFVLGILGSYIGFIFDQTKNRPHYLVEDFVDQQTKQLP